MTHSGVVGEWTRNPHELQSQLDIGDLIELRRCVHVPVSHSSHVPVQAYQVEDF